MSSSSFSVPITSHLHASYSHPVLRAWTSGEASSLPQTASYVWPLFLVPGSGVQEPLSNMDGQYRWSVDLLPKALDVPVAAGLRAVLLFGVQPDKSLKDSRGSGADADDSVVCRAIRLLRARYPDLLIMCDVCLCGYTDHGHCGVLTTLGNGEFAIDNEQSVGRLCSMSLAFARAGAHVIAPSDMMDGRIGGIKAALRGEGLLSRVAVMSYAAKFASCMYGPFRDAAASGMAFGDRQGYQLPAGSRSLALRAVARDVAEGADFVMVKPGGAFLDICRDVANASPVPVAAYQVSGEYAMLSLSAKAGVFDLKRAVLESVASFRRAGVTIVITYFAPLLLDYAALANDDAVKVYRDALAKRDAAAN